MKKRAIFVREANRPLLKQQLGFSDKMIDGFKTMPVIQKWINEANTNLFKKVAKNDKNHLEEVRDKWDSNQMKHSQSTRFTVY